MIKLHESDKAPTCFSDVLESFTDTCVPDACHEHQRNAMRKCFATGFFTAAQLIQYIARKYGETNPDAAEDLLQRLESDCRAFVLAKDQA